MRRNRAPAGRSPRLGAQHAPERTLRIAQVACAALAAGDVGGAEQAVEQALELERASRPASAADEHEVLAGVRFLMARLLAVRSLEPIWRLRIGVEGALVAASYAIRAKTYKGVAEASCGLLRPGNLAYNTCLLYTSPSPRDYAASRMPSSA